MKILQIAPPWISTPPKAYGGTELVIDNITKGLINLGHQVSLFATTDSKIKGISSLEYVFEKGLLELGIDWNMALPASLHYFEAFQMADQFDIIHAHLSSATDLICLPYLATTKTPHILTIHSNWPFDKVSDMDQRFLDLYAPSINAVSISQAHQNLNPDQFNKLGVVYNGLSLKEFKFNPQGGEYLTWLGKILPKKGLKEAILVAKATSHQLIFAGVVDKYSLESVKYFEEIKPLINGKQIIYLGAADL